MRTEEEIKKAIKRLQRLLTCPICGSTEYICPYWEEDQLALECASCRASLEGTSFDVIRLDTLKWVLGEKEELFDDITT